MSFVQLAPGADIAADELITYAREHLGAYKYPREIRFVDTLPLTSVMKLDRKTLRAQLSVDGAAG